MTRPIALLFLIATMFAVSACAVDIEPVRGPYYYHPYHHHRVYYY